MLYWAGLYTGGYVNHPFVLSNARKTHFNWRLMHPFTCTYTQHNILNVIFCWVLENKTKQTHLRDISASLCIRGSHMQAQRPKAKSGLPTLHAWPLGRDCHIFAHWGHSLCSKKCAQLVFSCVWLQNWRVLKFEKSCQFFDTLSFSL